MDARNLGWEGEIFKKIYPKSSKGGCRACNSIIPAGKCGSHLGTCDRIGKYIVNEQNVEGSKGYILHLKSKTRGKIYWMTVAAPNTATLLNLDEFMRQVWFQCCAGHYSTFSGTQRPRRSLGKSLNLDNLLNDEGKSQFTYTFDFADSCEIVGEIILKIDSPVLPTNQIMVLMRNVEPTIYCYNCYTNRRLKKLAPFYKADYRGFYKPFCAYCLPKKRKRPQDENTGSNVVTEEVEEDDDDDERPGSWSARKFYNSPRTGDCCYDGPAEISQENFVYNPDGRRSDQNPQDLETDEFDDADDDELSAYGLTPNPTRFRQWCKENFPQNYNRPIPNFNNWNL